jgi:hypothetical protein
MADTGKIVTKGLHAGAIKYVVTKGLVPNPSASTLIACMISKGYGITNRHKLVLRGLATNASVASGKVYAIFGGDVIA